MEILEQGRQQQGNSLNEITKVFSQGVFQEWEKAGKSPYDGVIDTDPDPNMTEDKRFVFNRHGHLTKIKAIRKKNEEILQMNNK